LVFNNCGCNLCILSTQALLLSKAAKKIITEDGSAALQKCVVALEKKNSQLKASNTKMQKTIDNSNETITVLRRAQDEEIENYELLKHGNDSLLDECNNA
jgi:malate synthase